MVSNKILLHPDNLLLDPKNPCCDTPDSALYSDVNTELWYLNEKKSECILPNHIIMLLYHFIDVISIDKYGKLTVEAVLTY